MLIRPIEKRDRDEYIKMAKDFYSSPVVLHPIPDENFENTFNELMERDTYAQCFIFEEAEAITGYALIAITFSQEAGGLVVWIEEIHVKEEYRGKGAGSAFFDFLHGKFGDRVKRFRLEVEEENEKAVKLYKSLGYEFFGYDQMVRE